MTPDAPRPIALVIDDERDIREMAKLALEAEGWDVRLAANGRDGLQLAREATPDLVLIDLMMPELSGIEVCRRFVEELGQHDVPVVLISGVSERARVLEGFWELPLRHREFLHKPFDIEQLLATVRRATPRFKPAASRPAAPAAAPPRPALAAPFEPVHRGYRVLVVDDDEEIRLLLKTGLGLFHDVITADNGMEGLNAFDAFRPDLVIMDFNMPIMNGLETAEAIRRHPRRARVPIFFLTGESDTSLARKVYDVGGNLYLRKPLDPVQLLKFMDHFWSETGFKPGEFAATEAGEPEAPPAPPAATRILTVDYNIEDHRLLQRLFGELKGHPCRVAGGPFETIYTDDPHSALGNLTRWEPDAILYNPRNPHWDGMAFVQSIRLQKAPMTFEIAFIGTRFFEADLAYSRTHFGRGVIELDQDEALVARALSDVAAAARRHRRARRFSIDHIHREEVERLRSLHASDLQLARQREAFRKQYLSLQEFIDRQFKA